MKAKPIYGIFYGFGWTLAMCPVKALNKTEAKTKFNKRYTKKRRIYNVELLDPQSSNYIIFKQKAF